MILEITRAEDLPGCRYNIHGGTCEYKGFAGGRHAPISLLGGPVPLRGTCVDSELTVHAPMTAHILGKELICYELSRNGEKCGKVFLRPSPVTGCVYEIHLPGDDVLLCYKLPKGKILHIPIYRQERQIALFEAKIRAFRKPVYRLYLPDDYAHLEKMLAFFALYVINHCLMTDSDWSRGRVPVAGLKSITMHRDKDDPAWLATHFPGVE